MLIAYATDLSGDDDAAFVHATALAVAGGRQLVTIHGNPERATVAELPDAAVLAARWGRTVSHERRCHECCDDVADAVLDAMHGLQPDLVVVGSHGRHGFSALVHASVGQAVARNLDVPVLVVPNGCRGFVDASTGEIDLSRIVIPAGNREHAQRGIEAARTLIGLGGARDSELEIVHVGNDEPMLDMPGVTITRTHGKLEHAILEVATARRACVIVMPTQGHDSLTDVALGSHTERVIREAACPVLSVPPERR
jgi:nucleotide-binding universal stress UspA family protein